MRTTPSQASSLISISYLTNWTKLVIDGIDAASEKKNATILHPFIA